MSLDTRIFTSGNLNGSYQLEWPHGHNTENILVKWYDDLGIERSTFDLLQVVDANNITLNCGEAITGQHKLVMYYETAGATYEGRRLFELSTTAAPGDT